MTNTIPVDAICQVDIWKEKEVRDFAVTVIKTALRLMAEGTPYFSSDDIPEGLQPESPSVSGIVLKKLCASCLICGFNGNFPEAGIYYGRRKSRRESAHGREIHLYQITSLALCKEFLRRYGECAETIQTELQLTP